ncbi:glycosyltransferase, partial [bacterium]|nr:glycosyltransferase [bacterium]
MPIQISVIIGTYNQVEVLSKVLDGYKRQSLPSEQFEVIVVDSGSKDGTADLLASFSADFQFKGIVQENRGKSGARNRAASEAQGNYLIITDADMIPDEQFVETHLRSHQATNRATCFEGITYNMTELHWPPDPKKIYAYIRRNYSSGKSLGWFYFLTGNLSLPKSLFDSENGFDESFVGY